MPCSRKRNKGKERRAKKEAANNSLWRGWAIGEGGCNHGCKIPQPDHAVSRFLNGLEKEWKQQKTFGPEGPAITMKNAITQPEVWNNAEHRQMAMDVLLCMGTNRFCVEKIKMGTDWLGNSVLPS